MKFVSRIFILCVFSVIAALILVKCSEVVTTRFATLKEAKDKKAFEQGWLPPVMPDSAKNIVETHDLDVNTGTGAFDYDLSERSNYVDRLKAEGATQSQMNAEDKFTLKMHGAIWVIALPHNSDHATYTQKPSLLSQ